MPEFEGVLEQLPEPLLGEEGGWVGQGGWLISEVYALVVRGVVLFLVHLWGRLPQLQGVCHQVWVLCSQLYITYQSELVLQNTILTLLNTTALLPHLLVESPLM